MTGRCAAGFTLVETLVGLVLMLVVTGAAVALVVESSEASLTQPVAMDMQQRARVAADALFTDLVVAGAGLELGPRTGPLGGFFPPVVPRRMGLVRPDGHAVARSDAITVAYVPSTTSQTRLRAPLPAVSSPLLLANASNCPLTRPFCGFSAGSTALVFNHLGQFDFFRVATVVADVGTLIAHRADASHPYAAGAFIAEARSRTYYHEVSSRQLRLYDGYRTDRAVVDDVVGLEFEYFGEPSPPHAPKPPLGVANCLYDAAGVLKPGTATLPRLGGTLAALPLSVFTDGPWCGSGQNQFDADLLRIRHVRVALRVQAGPDVLRASGGDVAIAGTGREARRTLPDYRVRFGVTPRNLGTAR